MSGKQGILYPDSGNPLEDASVLRNAVYFSTAERAYSTQLVLKQPLNVNQRVVDFLVVKAYEEFMTSTEDLLGWLFTLEKWQPGNAEFCLFLLLDKIKVGQGDYKEERAVSLLESLNEDSFRALCHIPTTDELFASGFSKKMVDNIKQSMPYKLEGWLRIAKRREEQNRGWVRMFNKFKHHMLAFPTTTRGKNEIWMPTSIKFDRDRGIGLGQGWLESSINELRRLAGDAIAAQAVLHDTLATLLISRYKEKYTVPQWVLKAYQIDYLWQR
ncbi:MAG: hypothetical protein WC231_01315 [Dehalococcoidales bacterium]|jgi:hypothetical protein|nr:hypothetical protein [Dehalococcoidales bacterium]MDX9986058.1 hypothetical protein [Dehalococcoidales bacterium]